MIKVRKLVAVDMALNGTQSILVEFAIGIVLPLILGLLSIRAGLFGAILIGWEIALGFWLLSIAANYVPMFIYAAMIARGGTVKEEGQSEIADAKRYGVQQVVILLPFLVVVLALLQESHKEEK